MYQMHIRNILFLIIFFVSGSISLFATNALAATAEEKQAKKDNKNIELFEKELKAGQTKLVENFGAKDALKAFKKASRYYKKVSDTAKATSEVSSLKSQLDSLTDQAETQSARDKIVQKDLKYLKTTNVSLKKVEGYIQASSVTSARRSLNSATTSFKKVSSTSLSRTEFVEAKSKIDVLTAQVEAAESQADGKRQLANNVMFSAADFRTYTPRNRIVGLLARGAGKTDLDQPMHARELKEAYDVANFDELDKSFKEKYGSLIQLQGDLAQSNGLTPNMILELYKNHVKYRDSFVAQNGKNHLEWKIAMLKKTNDTLNSEGYLMQIPNLLDELYGSKANLPFAEITEFKKYYDWTGQALPKNEVDILTQFKTTLRDSLKNAAQKHEWDSTKYPYTNGQIDKLAAQLCALQESDFVKVGITGENDWRIVKNALDIPTSRHNSGVVLCQHPDQPFLQGYDVGFLGTFNGIGYEPLSEGYVNGSTITPY